MEMCKQYLAEQRELLRREDPDALAPRTVRDYAEALDYRIIPAFGSMRIVDFRPTDAAQYLRRAKDERRAVRANREIAALASAFNFGMSMGVVASNPCRGVRRNRERPRTRSVSIEEVNALLAVAKKRGIASQMVALIAVTVALTGRRRSEILGLQQSALTPDGIEIEDAKTRRFGERRYLVEWSPLLRRVVQEASEIRPTSGAVFPTRSGEPYTDSGFKTEWNRLIRAYEAETGERFRAHDLRALYVSEMLDRGENPETHRNETTMRRVYDRRRTINVKPLA